MTRDVPPSQRGMQQEHPGRSLGAFPRFALPSITPLWWGALIALLWFGYIKAAIPVTLIVDGNMWLHYTHQTNIQDMLREAGITIQPQDAVTPPPDTPLRGGETVHVALAWPVTIEVDGRTIQTFTRQQRVDQILAAAGVRWNTKDFVQVDRQPRAMSSETAEARHSIHIKADAAWPHKVVVTRPSPLHIVVHRGVPITVHDQETAVTLYTVQSHVGTALRAAGVVLGPGDMVMPALDAPVSSGLHVFIRRALPITIEVDGRRLPVHTHSRSVGELLAEQGIVLVGDDYTLPPLDTPLQSRLTVQIVRREERLRFEQEIIPYETEWRADPEMVLDTQRLIQPGSEGVTMRRYRAVYENGVAVSEVLEREWVASVPTKRVVAYGTRILVRQLATPDGPIEYWRHIRALATSYNPASSGKPKDHPHYGITRTGLKAGFGVIAVDPKVIPLG
ncbi:MAG: ubiquitin-like domain-containing protein, partial [Anaerolineae bacterium]|nr:ubiquitin-like domain-containing protein [Anaerolineae bacterium]